MTLGGCVSPFMRNGIPNIQKKERVIVLGDFQYSNPTKLYFGEHSLEGLNQELPRYGKNVLLVYGGGSIKKNGIYDQVMDILRANGKTVFEDAGVMPNPTVEKLYEGCSRAREGEGGSASWLWAAVPCATMPRRFRFRLIAKRIPWEKYYLRMEDVDNKILPVGCVLTMVGTGSEMNGGVRHHQSRTANGRSAMCSATTYFPKFSILNPTVYLHPASLPDDGGLLRYHVPHIASSIFPGRTTIPPTI